MYKIKNYYLIFGFCNTVHCSKKKKKKSVFTLNSSLKTEYNNMIKNGSFKCLKCT